jgi:hypothetical protein
MIAVHIARAGRSRLLGIVAGLTLTLVGVTSAEAQQVQTLPGSSCQASGSAQDLSYSGVLVANRNNTTSSAICPIARQNGAQGWLAIAVFVRDRHSTQDITCVAQARDLTGAAGTGWSETQSSSGEGDQAIVFGAPGVGLPAYGPYTVVCSLPAMEEVNQPSYIASYVVVEP